MLSWPSCHKDYEQSFVPASKTELAKKIAPIWKFFTLIQALLMTSPRHHGKQTKHFVLVTTVVQWFFTGAKNTAQHMATR
jgi:hypothetical protein